MRLRARLRGLRHEVIKVHPESSPNCRLAIGPRVQGKADTRPKIFVGTLVPRLSKSRRFISQRIPEVGDLAIGLRRDGREFVAESQVQGEIGASLEVILEIKSQQALAPAPNVIAPGNVRIKLRRSCSEEIVQGVEEILPAVDAGEGGVALGSLKEHSH